MRMNRQIILASGSPRRKALLRQIGLKFKVSVSRFPEEEVTEKNPIKLAQILSLEKAQSVAPKFENAIIIGADTVVALGGTLLGKPRDKKEAERMLEMLSGNQHIVVTGVTVIDTKNKKLKTFSVKSEVWFRKLDPWEIKAYVATGEPMDKAGGYGVQEKGAAFIEKINGDFFNVVGLPLEKLVETLSDFGVTIW